MLYKDKTEHYFYYHALGGTWYAWEGPDVHIHNAQWIVLEPGLHDHYIYEHLQVSNKLEFLTLTGFRFRRPYWKVASKWKKDDINVWYTRGK